MQFVASDVLVIPDGSPFADSLVSGVTKLILSNYFSHSHGILEVANSRVGNFVT